MTPHAILPMFEQDFSERQERDNREMSQEDKRFIEITTSGIHKTDDGHYEMPLPFRDQMISMPCNRKLPETRLEQLRKRFLKNPRYKKDYVAFVEKMLEEGHAEAPSEYKRVWYIPHHGVYHPKKPEKICVVFDCSAEFQGHFLNRHLLQRPDLTNSLVGVLCRFRQDKVAVACDIKGMFHQVRVNEEHRDYLRFLWWDKGDITKEPEEHRMRVHLFGATSSPGCANLALRQAAQDGESVHGAEAATFVKENFYVDDGLVSTATIESAISLMKKEAELCRSGGFHLHKFTSNEREVIESITEEDRAKNIKNLDLNTDALPPECVLGVEWCMESNTFQFRIALKDRPMTRRGILSSVSSIYDPLGFAAPFLLRGKRILQLLCKEAIDWDDPIPDTMQAQWQRWVRELPLLEKMRIPRCFKPSGMRDIKKVELHHFSDASTEGYGQSTYLRLTDVNDLVHCSLVMGKARVAPLKPVTIPRLELTAALTSVRVSLTLGRELTYAGVKEVFWTDSKVVQGYIYNEARRFHTYVANRVQQIRDHTQPEQWKYVDSDNNPADDASRGLSPKELLKTSRWLHRPTFHWEPHDRWQDFDDEPPTVHPDDKEVKKTTVLNTVTIEPSYVLEVVKRFSNWFRTKRVLGRCLNIARTWKTKAAGGDTRRGVVQNFEDPVTVETMSEPDDSSSRPFRMKPSGMN
ncbi:uncharacterized protein [Montipora foliosa]|uniref:uncharacterized protein n=1 Tax=Montipora foliosa TaxID=591990 RepID=UPI0035F1AF89